MNETGRHEQAASKLEAPAVIPAMMVRDGYVAETAIKLDRLEAQIKRLERESEPIRRDVHELMDNAEQVRRHQAFSDSLRNARDLKLDELQRGLKHLRARIEQIEGPQTILGHLRYKDLEHIDRRLLECDAMRSKLVAMQRAITVSVTISATTTVMFLVAASWSLLRGG